MAVALDTTELDKVLRGLSADGRDFEVLCRWFLLSDPVWSRELDEVWLWDDYPDRWGRDCGIDLVARRKDGTLIAVQAKNYGPATTITKADVDTFLSESARAAISDRLLIGTTDRLAAAARSVIDGQDKAVATLLLSDLHESEVDWSSAHFLAPTRLPPLVPRPDQNEALAEIAAWAAAGGTRGKVVRACGTGKSLVAVLAADQLEARRVLVVTPGLGLLHQTEAVWARNATLDRRTLRICSSTSSDASVDTRERRLSERTTHPDRIAELLTRSEPLLVLCTYESSATLAKAIREARAAPFDLVIADEAHRCAGPVTSNFRTLLSDEAIPAQRRLFFTATPAVFGTRDKAKAASFSVQLASMDNEQLFGPIVHHLSFSEAVERQLLCRYQVAVIPIGSDEVDRLIQDRRYVHAGGPTHLEALELAVQVACARAMRDYGCRRIVSFHRTVADSRRFSAHLPTAMDLLREEERPVGRLWAAHVDNSGMKAAVRAGHLRRFRQESDDELRVLSNVKLLTEGTDVPEIDGIVLVDTRRSQSSIIQAVGRAMRRSPGKDVATVILPVIVRPNESIAAALLRSEHADVVNVLAALKSHDPEILKSISGLRFGAEPSHDAEGPPGRFLIAAPIEVDSEFADAIEVALARALGTRATRKPREPSGGRRLWRPGVERPEPTDEEVYRQAMARLHAAGRYQLVTRVDLLDSPIMKPWWAEVCERWNSGKLSIDDRREVADAASWLAPDLDQFPRQRTEMALLSSAHIAEQIVSQLEAGGRYRDDPRFSNIVAYARPSDLAGPLVRLEPRLAHRAMSRIQVLSVLLQAMTSIDGALAELSADLFFESWPDVEGVLDGFEDGLTPGLDRVDGRGSSWRRASDPVRYVAGRRAAGPLRERVREMDCFDYPYADTDLSWQIGDDRRRSPNDRLDHLGREIFLLARKRNSSHQHARQLGLSGTLRQRQAVREDLMQRSLRTAPRMPDLPSAD